MADEKNLRGADLRKEKLKGANLSRADLRGANLVMANLSDADFFGADLRGAHLSEADLRGADLSEADRRGADLRGAILVTATLTGADLSGANLVMANLSDADFFGADLGGAHLSEADLREAFFLGANLSGADLRGANLHEAQLFETMFADVNLSDVIGLETCVHLGPSIVDFRTLQRSGTLPMAFLRGVGLPDSLIEYLPSLLNQPTQMYSCFISYSSKDEHFAERLHADLQNKGVRCWFAPHDLPIGAKTWDAIDEAIRLRDKLLLILSENSIASDWVEDEVNKAFAEERNRKRLVF